MRTPVMDIMDELKCLTDLSNGFPIHRINSNELANRINAAMGWNIHRLQALRLFESMVLNHLYCFPTYNAEKINPPRIGNVLYRGANLVDLDRVISTGSDVPNAAIGTQVYAAPELEKAVESNRHLIQIYDSSGLQKQKEGGYYEILWGYVFIKRPNKILKAILVLER